LERLKTERKLLQEGKEEKPSARKGGEKGKKKEKGSSG